jgi:DNA polymerase-3 subunit gamma/tau
MSYVVLALKWRPKTFDEVAGQTSVSLVLKRALEAGRTGHAYLFAGPRGIGKTSMARILAKSLNCEKGPTPNPCGECDACREITRGTAMDVLEIDGASNRGIDDIRELKETVRYSPSRYRTKVTIIDEVHMLTPDAFNALLKTLEEPPSHAVFILATTEPLRVPQTILSRCQRFDFGRLTVAQIVEHLEKICGAEGIQIERDALTLLARRAEGSVRDALTLLDQVAASGKGPFDQDQVQTLLGISSRSVNFEVTEAMSKGDVAGVLDRVESVYQQGLNLQELMEELIQHVRNLLIMCTDERLEDLLEATEDERQRYREQSKSFTPEDLLRILRILMDESARMRRSPFPRFHIELALAECATLPSTEDLARVLRSLGSAGDQPPGAGGVERAAGPQTRSRRSVTGERKGTTRSAPEGSARAMGEGSAQTRGEKSARSLGEVDAGAAQSATAPAARLGDGDEGRWHEVMTRIRTRKIALATCLAQCKFVQFAEGLLLVERKANDAFLSHQLEIPAHRRLIHEAVGEVFGSGIQCRFVEPSAQKEEEAQPQTNHVQRIAEFMDGDIQGPAY